MITERQFANHFQSFWNETLPLFTPNYVKFFNEAYVETLTDESGVPLKSIPHPDGTLTDLSSEIAYQIVKSAHYDQLDIRSASRSESIVKNAFERAISFLGHGDELIIKGNPDLTSREWQDVRQLLESYVIFLTSIDDSTQITFEPSLPGSGFLNSCQADLSVGETLFEIKTVKRNFAGKDIRQLLIYLALQSGSHGKRWIYIGLFNPRRGSKCRIQVDQLIHHTSGGKTTETVYQEILEFLSSRDVQIDAKF